ncbi:MAG: hypothetical protein BWY65_01903 [Firmicutes bacterium ADurb.Bin373]|nr:MAG: hypothetical protein BWY65_01903 [Firmicutes bacterium ADurb.Bin373]
MKEDLHNRLALPGISRQQPAELALGEHYHLPELAALKAQQLFHDLGDLAPTGSQDSAFFSVFSDAGPIPQGGVGGHGGGPCAPLLGPFLLGVPQYTIAVGAYGKVKGDLRGLSHVRMAAAHLLSLALRAAGVPVKGEADGVEDGSFA